MTPQIGHLAATFDQFEDPDTRRARWEAAAHAAGREVDRNALRVYMAVADAEQQRLADDWARTVAASNAEVRRLQARVAELEEERRLEWLQHGLMTPHTPRICECGHTHQAHTAPAPHSCFAHGQTCGCPAYRQMSHDDAVAHVARKQAAPVGGEDTRSNR